MQIIKYKDGNGYLAKDNENKHKRVPREELATRFENGDAARFIKNCVQKLFRDRLEIIDLLDEKASIKENNISQNKTSIGIVETPFNSLDFDWITKLKQEDEFRKNLDIYKYNLPVMLDIVNNELCDIEHYIEFSKFNARDGYKLAKLLKEKREQRRKIKDELQVIEVIYRDWVDSHKSENVYKLFEGRETRVYEPRILKDLFKNCEKRDGL